MKFQPFTAARKTHTEIKKQNETTQNPQMIYCPSRRNHILIHQWILKKTVLLFLIVFGHEEKKIKFIAISTKLIMAF